MRRVVWRWGWTAVLGSGLLAGCEHTGAFQRYPPDPLFVRAKPVAGRPSVAAPALARSEPMAPTAPLAAIVKRPSPLSNPSARVEAAGLPEPMPGTPSSIGVLTGRERTSVPAMPAVRIRELPPQLERSPDNLARPALGAFPRDYTWLEGALERDPRGHIMLRYATPSAGETWGGKLVLDDDARLERFEEGAAVRVEGQMVFENGQPAIGWQGYPRYHIDVVTSSVASRSNYDRHAR